MAYNKPIAQINSTDPRIFDVKHNHRNARRRLGRARQQSFELWCAQTSTVDYHY